MAGERHRKAVLDYVRAMGPVAWKRLVDEGSLTVRFTELPLEHRRPILETIAAFFAELNEDERRTEAVLRERLQAEGKPVSDHAAHQWEVGGVDTYRLALDFRLQRQPELWVQVWDEKGSGYTPAILRSDETLPGIGEVLYADRQPRRPAVGEAAPLAGAGRLAEPLRVPPDEKPSSPPRWAATLKRASELTGLAFYCDDYLQEAEFRRRLSFARGAGRPLYQVLDGLCSPVALNSAGFWWRRGDSVLFRSRQWLWEQECLLPAAVAETLPKKLAGRVPLDPEDLRALASLSAPQAQSILDSGAGREAWKYAVQLPARFSLETQRTYMRRGRLKWTDLSPVEQTLVAREGPSGAAESFSVVFSAGAAAPDGSRRVTLNATWGGRTLVGTLRLPPPPPEVSLEIAAPDAGVSKPPRQ